MMLITTKGPSTYQVEEYQVSKLNNETGKYSFVGTTNEDFIKRLRPGKRLWFESIEGKLGATPMILTIKE